MSKQQISNEVANIIAVERLSAQIELLRNSLRNHDLNWYPEAIRPTIQKFIYNDLYVVNSAVAEWLDSNIKYPED